MPSIILVLSDMQFDESQSDYGQSMPHFNHMKELYKEAGYDFPKIVFWNLEAHWDTPAKCSDDSVAMVSGFSPSIMKAILEAGEFNPISIMEEAVKPIELDYTNLSDTFEYEFGVE